MISTHYYSTTQNQSTLFVLYPLFAALQQKLSELQLNFRGNWPALIATHLVTHLIGHWMTGTLRTHISIAIPKAGNSHVGKI